jgi:RNase adaptor protein for sRNA GlmZ degradation
MTKRARPAWATKIEEKYDLDASESALLEAAEQAWQRWQDLAARIDADGVLVEGRYENTERAHPLLSQESVARQAFMRALRALKVEEV